MHPPPAPDLPADAVAIRRLRVRAAAAAGASATDRQVRRALTETNWPRPAGEAWVLLRSVTAQARTPTGIGAAAARAVAAQIAAAVDLGDPAAAQSDAVCARDRDLLIAYLARDLALGQARSRWYWRPWAALLALPAATALRDLLAGQPARLAAVTGGLAALGALAPVWQALTADAADDLLARVAHALGLHLPAAPTTADVTAPDDTPAVPLALVERWRPALAGLPETDARTRLAVLLMTLEWRPLWLTADTAVASTARRLAAVAADLRGAPRPAGALPPGRVPGTERTLAPPAATGPLSNPPARWTSDPSPTTAAPAALSPPARPVGLGPGSPAAPERVPSPPAAGAPPPATPDPEQDGGDATGSGVPPTAAGADQRPSPTLVPTPLPPTTVPRHSDLDRLRVRDSGAAPAPHPTATPAAAPGPAGSAARSTPVPALYTGEGGLFYLINFLARPEAQALLAARASRTDADGWVWLYGLGRRLGLDPAGALAAFLADQRRAPWPQDADTDALLDRLADLGARLYGGADASDDGARDLWGPSLLAVPALVEAGPSHLDIRYPLTGVRLAVRRVALDVSPGWVPWLGRLIRLHYVDPWPGPPR
ncbi:MAG: hypothetical protein MUC77_08030 [Chromatiaceae bacterium]|jgi:hypothetical protein|nr:hypothetical protein [Chromatiaceae bacterium]